MAVSVARTPSAPVFLLHAFSVLQPVSAPVDPHQPPAILVVHGALGDATQMRPLADALGALGTVHLVELPGHGATALSDDDAFTMALFAETIGHAAGRHRHRHGDLAPLCFGYSMGGYAALLLEATSPGTLGGIVTLGTKFEWTPDVAAAAATRLDAAVLRAKVPAFAEQLRARHEGAGGWELLLARTARLLTGLGAATPLTAQRLSKVRIPVRLVVGSRDDTVTLAEAAGIASLMPAASAHELPDVPHPIERVPAHRVVDQFRNLTRDLPQD